MVTNLREQTLKEYPAFCPQVLTSAQLFKEMERKFMKKGFSKQHINFCLLLIKKRNLRKHTARKGLKATSAVKDSKYWTRSQPEGE